MGAKAAPFLVSRSARSSPSIPECEGQYRKRNEAALVVRRSHRISLILTVAI